MSSIVPDDIALTLVADQLAELHSRGFNSSQLGRLFDYNQLGTNLYNAVVQGLADSSKNLSMIKVSFSGHASNQICMVNLVYRLDKNASTLQLFSFSGALGNKNRQIYLSKSCDMPEAQHLASWVNQRRAIVPGKDQNHKQTRR